MPAIRLDFTSEAAAEVQAARDWYGARSPSAALGFVQEVAAAVRRIRSSPDRWPQAPHGTRRLLLHRFPFAVFYRRKDRSIQVVAVAHLKRRPGYWRDRLRPEDPGRRGKST